MKEYINKRTQMKRIVIILSFILVYFLIVGPHGTASEQKLPVIDGKITVATVNEEPITLEEFNRAIGKLRNFWNLNNPIF